MYPFFLIQNYGYCLNLIFQVFELLIFFMLMMMSALTIIIMDVHYLGLIFKVIHQPADFKKIHLLSTSILVLHDYYYLD